MSRPTASIVRDWLRELASPKRDRRQRERRRAPSGFGAVPGIDRRKQPRRRADR